MNPFLNRLANQRIGEAGRKSEKRIAKETKARLTPASGALRSAKGDMVRDTPNYSLLVESKATQALSLSLEQSWLTKITHEASGQGKVPCLTVSFIDSDGKARNPRNAEWAVIPRWFLDELLERR